MIWKIMSATVVFYAVWVVYFLFSVVANEVGGQILPDFGSLTPLGGGQSVAQVFNSAYAMFGVGIVITVIFLFLYLGAGSQADEYDSSVLGEF